MELIEELSEDGEELSGSEEAFCRIEWKLRVAEKELNRAEKELQ